MTRARSRGSEVPHVILRAPSAWVRFAYAVAAGYLVILIAMAVGGSLRLLHVLLALVLIAAAFVSGVMRFEVDRRGLRRTDALGRTSDWSWDEVERIELRDRDLRARMTTGSPMVVRHRDGSAIPVAAGPAPGGAGLARRAVAAHATARRIPLVDGREREG